MARVKVGVCGGGSVSVGDVLIFDNSAGNKPCVITDCLPPLDQSGYIVFPGETTAANVVGPTGTYFYHCTCENQGPQGGDPKLIVK